MEEKKRGRPRVNRHNPYYEWEPDFVSCELSIREFGHSKGLTETRLGGLYTHVRENKWLEKRERYFQKAREKFMDKAPETLANKWVEQRRLVSDLHKQLARASKKLKDEEDKEAIAEIVKKIADSLDTLVKTESFMDGGPTERTENKNLNLHVEISAALKERDAKFGISEEPAA